MALVAYSDSEDSGDEQPIAAAKPIPAQTAAKAVPFQKTEARKIKVDLPTLKTESGQNAEAGAEQPPAKRARTAGAFGGFNSLLPAPKRAAAQPTGLKKGVSLKTSSEAAFSRVVPAMPDREAEDAVQEEVFDEFGNTQAPASAVKDSGAETEVKIVGKSTRFKPLSVANNKKKKVVKKAPAAADAQPEKRAPRPAVEQDAGLEKTAPAPKPKKSLFSVQHDEEALPEPSADNYDALDALEPEQDIQLTFAQPTPAPVPNSLDAIAADMNLMPAQRRQLFGRHAKDMPVNIAHFNMDAEYAANEVIRHSGETVEHRAVKAVAPGKHSLQQLVNNARSSQDSIEDKWAEGRRARGEGGSKYGWGK
ncbi:hypothetical protein LTR56_025177 [Elasticomyces elasticus]|nr:hypothetical protein LTR56_025177 [Elasticomyces elasticus]KAK3621066.1 hypothetical protein LTR22_025351 [Elasticomyces elasticus]KAK4904532.1 hypothetical protein LTR49_026031 [Elasticomyces elasticus]